MRYEFYGRKSPYAGKTLWEIVGNLKNFGVGRLVRKCKSVRYEYPSFIRIKKVQPLPPPKSQFSDRRVMVWVDEYFNGKKKCENELWKTAYFPHYHLIPKAEEEELYKRLQECEEKLPKPQVYKYLHWPPLFKKLWEMAATKDSKIPPLPKLETIQNSDHEKEIIYIDDVRPPPECKLYKTGASVEEKLKEIVHLKKLINAKTPTTE